MRGFKKVEETASGKKPSVPIIRYDPQEYVAALDFNSIPEEYKEALEVAICTLLDPDSGHIVLTGSSTAGKTFFGAQILYSADRFLKNYKLGSLYPLRITRSDYNEFAPYSESAGDYLRKVAEELDIDVSEICVFTDHTDVAGRIAEAGTGARIVFEAPESMYEAMGKAQAAGITSVWSGWEGFDISSIYLRRRDLVEMVYQAQHDRLAAIYGVELKRKHIISIANALIASCDAMRHEDGSAEDPYVMVIPSYVAIMAKRFVQLLSAREEGTDINREETNQLIERVFEHTGPLVDEAHRNAHAFHSGEDRGATITVAAGSPEEARAVIREMGLQLSPEEEEELFGADSPFEPEPKTSDFRGKFRSIPTLERSLKKEIIGQDLAISRVVDALSIPAAGMHSPKKPLRTFLFLGPTGVGKTELSLQLAENLYTDPLNVIRLDMSEFSTEGATTSLFGSTPGYIGYSEDGGMLTREVAKHPHSLIILDEVEKAKPSTWDAFLQVLDAGRMTTGSGKVVDFSSCVIVMTSNLGTEEMNSKAIGFGGANASAKSPELLDKIAKSALKKHFRPEFINRIDEIVVFNQLGSESARKIVKKELRNVSKLIEPRGHSLIPTSNDILDSLLASSEFDQYGARDIQRTIQKKVSVPLAKMVLSAGKTPKKFKLQKSSDSGFSVQEA